MISQNLEKIKNIVVVMLENRSFDMMLGWLYADEKPLRGQAYEGLNKHIWNPLNNIDADGIAFIEKVPIHKNGESSWKYGKEIKHPVDFTLPNPDPGEGFKDTNEQLFEYYQVANEYPPEPTNRGFVNNYNKAMLYGAYSFGDEPTNPRKIMTTFTPEQLPVLSTLAKKYAVCDQWFCSVPSQTLANRDFVHAATSTGQVNNHPNSICNAKTIYNLIEEAIDEGRTDLSWHIYGSNPLNKKDYSFKDNQVGHEQNSDYFSLTRVIMSELHDSKFDKNFRTINNFYDDCKSGELPRYSFLEPIFHGEEQNDQHPPQDVRAGEQFLADIYNHLVDSPQWQETLLVITYDEHGGCFDHVPPPKATPPAKDSPGQDSFLFNRLGVRVPTVLVSPFIEEGTICRAGDNKYFDHTSIISTARLLFGFDKPLTDRDAAAPDLGSALNLNQARTDKVILKPQAYEKKDAGANDLHKTIAVTLSNLIAVDIEEGQDSIEFSYKAYSQFFYEKKGQQNIET